MKRILSLLLIGFWIAGCSTSTPAPAATPTTLFGGEASPAVPMITPTSPPPLTAPTAEATQAPAASEFTLAVIVDSTTAQVTREQAQALVTEATTYLDDFSRIPLKMIDYVDDARGGSMAEIVDRYVAPRSAPLPNGLVIFSAGDNGQARTSGGYGFSVPIAGYRNVFASPVGGAAQLYVAVVDAAYQAPAGSLYASTPTHAAASMIVHGLLHNFAPNGDKDDYSTPECNARMGYPAGYFNRQESEYYNGLCPYVYEEFTNAFKP